MKKISTMLCTLMMACCFTSCENNETQISDMEEDAGSRTVSREVQGFIEKARYGNSDAYKALAECYRDGNGVEQSNINAIYMYLLYCEKVGKGDMEVLNFFEDDSPVSILLELLLFTTSAETINQERLAQLQKVSPAEAKTFSLLAMYISDMKDDNFMKSLQEAEKEGSEMAVILQAMCYEEHGPKEEYQDFLLRVVDKYPFLYKGLANICTEKYVETNDYSYVQKEMEYMYNIDKYGMLSHRQANHLWTIYDYFSQKGLLQYDEAEISRLKKIMEKDKKIK